MRLSTVWVQLRLLLNAFPEVSATVFIFIPDLPHFDTACQQLIERAVRGDSSILEKKDLSRHKQSNPTVAYNQKRRFTFAQQTTPELFLCHYIQRARKIVKNQKIGTTREHPGHAGALDLTA